MLFLFCTGAPGQIGTMGFETLTSEHGLSDNYVLSAIQDHRGFLWFGTRDGLNRFDGYTFAVYRHDPGNMGSIADGSAKCIYEDSRKEIWIGTHSSGLDRFDRATERFHHYRHNPHDTTTIGDGPISSICEDHRGDIWVATKGRGDGASMLDRATNRFIRFGHHPDDPYSLSGDDVVAVCRDSSGRIWVATSDEGLNLYDPSICGFINGRTRPAYHVPGWGNIQSVQTDRSGHLWLLTPDRLFRFDPATGRSWQEPFDIFAGEHPHSLATVLTDQGGTRWIAAYAHGLAAHNPHWKEDLLLRHSPSMPNSLPSNTVFCICEDRAGNLWFGSEHGISRLSRRSWQFRWLPHIPYQDQAIAAPTVRSLALDEGRTLWAGTDGGGLERIDLASAHVEHNSVGGDGKVNTVVISRNRDVWFGTTHALVCRSPDGTIRKWRHDPGDSGSIGSGAIWSILEDRSGRLWVGTLGGGLSAMDPRTGRFRHYYCSPDDPASLSDNSVLTITESRDGMIWAGTDKGLSRLDPATGRFRRYLNEIYDSASISNNRVWYIHEDSSGAFWIATSGGGVNRMDPRTGRFRRYMENNGFVNNTACAIVEDRRGRIWCSTNKGLSCIDPAAGTTRNFAPSDGLPVYEFHFKACAKSHDGTIYFGGRGGILYFHPDSLLDNVHAPPVELVSFRTRDTTFVPDASITTATTVRLRHDNNSFTVEFAALDFTNPSGNRYRYKLEGYDNDWRIAPATHRFAEYTSVPPGNYRFIITGANSDGVWSAEARTLDIVIPPRYWQTWWFPPVMAMAALLAVTGLLLARVRNVRRKEQSERRMVEFQLQALRAQMNPHFMFNALNSILYFVTRHDTESAQFYLTGFSRLVRTTLDNVQNDAVSLADELESLRLYLRMESLRFRDRFDVSIEVSPLIDPEEVQLPPMIIQPYVENAIRHGLSHKEERGTLSIRISRRMGYLRCSIQDDGVGRQRSGEIQRDDLRAHRAYGMAVTHNRLEALSRLHGQRYRATITDLSGDQGATGTRVDILIPLDIPHKARPATPTHHLHP